MSELAFKLVVCLALAALIGFVVAWLLRGARAQRSAQEVATQNTRLLEADRRAMLHQTELANRDKRIGILEADLNEEKKRFAELFAEFQRNDKTLAELRAQGQGAAPAAATDTAAVSEVAALQERIAQLENDLRECGAKRAELHAKLLAGTQRPAPYDGTPPRQFTELPALIDDLKHIYGVGPVLEKMLQKLGIYLFKQVAQWNEADIDFFDAKLDKFHGRIRREGWVRSAIEEHYKKYGEWLGEGEPALTKPETNRGN
jgi:predicted flap endonuclease-1-like 5' DNA nuclease